MSEKDEQKMLNPQITELDVGIRNLRKITVYPLSMSDQLKLTDIVTKALKDQFEKDQTSDLAIVSFITELIKDNMGRILSMVTDEDGEAMLNELTNLQATEIAMTIYEVNYGIVAKNFKSLFEKLSLFFPSGRPLPQSVNDMDTNLTTSTEKPGEMEA